MRHFIFPTIQYIRHFLLKEDLYSLQSPLIYQLIKGWHQYQKEKQNLCPETEKIRRDFLNDQSLLEIQDRGAGSRIFKGKKRKIASIARISCSSRKWATLYQYLCRQSPAVTVLELGTCLGITTAYLSKVCKGQLYTFEGDPSLAKLAETHLDRDNKVKIITGNLDLSLIETLSNIKSIDFALMDANHSYEATKKYYRLLKTYLHTDSILVIGDIYWSKGMNQAWNEIIQEDFVTLSMDFYHCGVLLFKKGLTKSHFLL